VGLAVQNLKSHLRHPVLGKKPDKFDKSETGQVEQPDLQSSVWLFMRRRGFAGLLSILLRCSAENARRLKEIGMNPYGAGTDYCCAERGK